ncbi:Cytokinin hydroxylase [Hibiscus syriacus]|uniref:Cytokinin hydroxylase n=1 Tax=Hibiscus syriacus TaxID=106335 RepID=A0A6A3AY04_HIBSY|nr:Cytokinin hydroxylase [Hibiscus syriacus]
MAAMVVCFTTLSVLFMISLFKLVLDTISCYLLIPRRIRKTMEKQGVHGPKPIGVTHNILKMFKLTSESTSKDMETIHHDIVGRLLPHYVKWSKSCGKSWLQQQGSEHFTGRVLLMANDRNWYHQHHIAAPAFMGDKLKSYSGHMVECTKQMIQSLQNAVYSGQSEFEIGEYMSRLSAYIIARTEFDSSYEKGKQIFHLLTSMQHLCAQASRHLCFPGSREMKSLKMEVDRLLIQNRKDCVEIGRSSSHGNDLLGVLLNEMEKKRGDKFKLNMQLIMDECKTFFFAGHETTALLLTYYGVTGRPAELVPAMQKGNETARSLHIALNTVNVILFIWQIPTGIEIGF